VVGAIALLVVPACGLAPTHPEPPYPASDFVTGIALDWSTHDRRAPESDNWPMTWADDGNHYTAWGDGGGFGGTHVDGRVSLGVARVEGGSEPDDHRGFNVWGGKDAAHPATFTGKSYGILAVGAALYLWQCGAGSGETVYEFQQLHRSTDGGATWAAASWRFEEDDGFFCPTFVQFGQGNREAKDGHAWVYAPRTRNDEWEVSRPGEILLLRAPVDRLMDRAAWRFYAGLESGVPVWSADVDDAVPAFEDRANGVLVPSALWHRPLGRYFLITGHTANDRGNIGIYEAPAPWGPWRTVLFDTAFGVPHIEPNTFFWNFAPGWFGPDGLEFVLVFTGRESNDSWNTVRGRFEVGPATAEPTPSLQVIEEM
jgi:hypothetical protein